jgi:hypothetical protein
MIALLSIYAAQVGSYTTLLWQVPALSLTAQSFLLTIALSGLNGTTARVTAAGLSVVISLSSYALMHDQRGHAINHGELAMRLSAKLELGELIKTSIHVEDGVPKKTNADTLWTWHDEREGRPFSLRAGRMYAVWKGCMFLFALVDVGIIASVFMSIPAAVAVAAGSGFLVALVALLIHLSQKTTSEEDAGETSLGEQHPTAPQLENPERRNS